MSYTTLQDSWGPQRPGTLAHHAHTLSPDHRTGHSRENFGSFSVRAAVRGPIYNQVGYVHPGGGWDAGFINSGPSPWIYGRERNTQRHHSRYQSFCDSRGVC